MLQILYHVYIIIVLCINQYLSCNDTVLNTNIHTYLNTLHHYGNGGSFSIKLTVMHMNICVIQYVWNFIVCMCAVSIFCLAWLKVCRGNLMHLQYIHWQRVLETLLLPLTAMALPIWCITCFGRPAAFNDCNCALNLHLEKFSLATFDNKVARAKVICITIPHLLKHPYIFYEFWQ